MWPVGSFHPAHRSSVNQLTGAMEWHHKNVTSNVRQKSLLEKTVPAMMAKWLRGEWANTAEMTRSQQDGAGSHMDPEDEEFNVNLVELGVSDKLLLFRQPADPPDTNMNDLGFFLAIAVDHRKKSPKDSECMRTLHIVFKKHTRITL